MKVKNPIHWLKIESDYLFSKLKVFDGFANNKKILKEIEDKNLTEISVYVYETILKVVDNYIIDAIGYCDENYSKYLENVFLPQGYKNHIIRCSKLNMSSEDYKKLSDYVDKYRIHPDSTEDEILLMFNPKIEVLAQEVILDLFEIY